MRDFCDAECCVPWVRQYSDNIILQSPFVDEISMETVDEYGNTYRDSPYSTQMTEETFDAVFGNTGQETG